MSPIVLRMPKSTAPSGLRLSPSIRARSLAIRSEGSASPTGRARNTSPTRLPSLRGSPVDEVRALVPVNLRRPGAPLPRKLGNRFGLVFLALPVGLADPSERMAKLRARMDGLKRSPEGAVLFGILNTIGLIPTQVESVLVDILATKGTMVVTDVPGPRQTD